MSYLKINPKWIKSLNIKLEIIRFLEENIGNPLTDIILSRVFFLLFIFWYVSLDKGDKSKSKQMGLYQPKNPLYCEGNDQQNEKISYWMGEDTCKWHIWEGVNIQNIQRTHTTQYPKNNMIEKWPEDLNRCFPKKIYTLPAGTWQDAQHR